MLKLLRTCYRPAYQTVKHHLEVCEVVEQVMLVLLVLLYNDLTIEGLFYCALA